MAADIIYSRTAERPDLEMWVRDRNGALIDFTGYTFSFKLGRKGTAAVFTKTSGISGAAGAGDEPSGTPNIVVTFTAGELAAVPAKKYTWQLTATTGGLDRVYDGGFILLDVIT